MPARIQNELGKITFSDLAIASLAGMTAVECYGVVGMASTKATDGLNELLKRENLARGVKVTGATVHFVNEVPDGGEILLQKAVDVLPGDTPEVLQRRVMEQAEWKLLPQAAQMISEEIGREKAE